MTQEQFDQLQTMTLESGQKLVEIEANVWVDFDTYNPAKNVNMDGGENGGRV